MRIFNFINYFIVIFLLFFQIDYLYSNEKNVNNKNKLKIEIPLSSERVLMPQIGVDGEKEIILIPPKNLIEINKKAEEERKLKEQEALRKAE